MTAMHLASLCIYCQHHSASAKGYQRSFPSIFLWVQQTNSLLWWEIGNWSICLRNMVFYQDCTMGMGRKTYMAEPLLLWLAKLFWRNLGRLGNQLMWLSSGGSWKVWRKKREQNEEMCFCNKPAICNIPVFPSYNFDCYDVLCSGKSHV